MPEYAPALPLAGAGRRGIGWWGLMSLVLTEGCLFVYLLFSYFYFETQMPKGWSPEPHPSLKLALPNTAILVLSSVAVWWGEKGVVEGRRGRALGGLSAAWLLGLVFLGIQAEEYREKSYTLSSGPYGSLFFTVTGFHMAHVVVGVLVLMAVTLWTALGYFDKARNAPVLIGAAYWHFVDGVWLCVFTSFYLLPYLR